MRIKKRTLMAALVSPLMLIGVLVEPAQAITVGSCVPSDYLGVKAIGTPWGTVDFSSKTTAAVHFKISYPQTPSSTIGSILVRDHGTVPTREYQVGIREDGVWHAVQGPYNRKAGSLVEFWVFAYYALPLGQTHSYHCSRSITF